MITHFIIILCLVKVVVSSNVLIVNIFQPFSHFSSQNKIATELTKRGHNVTMLTTVDTKDFQISYRKIYVNITSKAPGYVKTTAGKLHKSSDLQKIDDHIDFVEKVTEIFLSTSTVQDFLNINETFDVVVVNDLDTFGLYAFCARFNSLCVTLVPCQYGMVRLISYRYPSSLTISPWLNKVANAFFERIYSIFVNLYAKYKISYYLLPIYEKTFKKYLGVDNLTDALYNIDLVFETSNVNFNCPEIKPPNLLQIGGYHLREPNPKIVSRDVQDFLDNSRNGVIFLSMGSALDIPEDLLQVFLKTFARIDLNVICKSNYFNTTMPKNVKVAEWVPQIEILGHPNMKLFISHVGIHSTIEGITNGVPILAIPVVWDQHRNAKILEERTFSKVLNYKNVTETKLFDAINEMVGNKRYKEKAVSYAKLFKSASIDPFGKTIKTFENLMKYGKATHLKVPMMKMEWYEYYNYDVFLFFAALLVIKVYIAYKLLIEVIKKLFQLS